MPRAPKGVSLVFCDRMQIDPSRAEMSLVGLFLARQFRTFPTPPQQFTAFTLLYGGQGEGRMVLDIKRADSEVRIYRYQRWTGFAFPDRVTMCEIPVTRCVFSSPGRYIAELKFEGEIVSQRVLDVVKE